MNEAWTGDRILREVIFPAIEIANRRIPRFGLSDPNPLSPLYGVANARLDSMGLVTFVFILEAEIKRACGRALKITANDVLNRESNPLEHPQALSLFLSEKLAAAGQEKH